MDKRLQNLVNQIGRLDADYKAAEAALINDYDVHAVFYLSDPGPAVLNAQRVQRDYKVGEIRRECRAARDAKLEDLLRPG